MAAPFTFTNRQLYVPGPLADLQCILTAWGLTQRQIEDHQDKFAYVLNRVVTAPSFNRRIEPGDYVRINQAVLREVLSRNGAEFVLKTLVGEGILECDGRSSARSGKSLGYRIAERYQGKAVGLSIFKQETFGCKLQARSDARTNELRKDRFLNRIHKNLTQLRICHQEAHAHLDAVKAASIEFLHEHKFGLSVNLCSIKAYAALLEEAGAQSPLIMLPKRKDVAKRVKQAHERGEFEKTYYQDMQNSIYDAHVANTFAVERLRRLDFMLPKRPPVRRKIGRVETYFEDVGGQKVNKFRTVFVKDTARKPHRARVYTFLTNLATHLRPFLYHVRHEDEVLVNLDIRNSQPFLLNVLLNRRYEGQELPKDVRRYMRLTASGTFYELVARCHGRRADSYRERREFKSKFFGSVFFCKIVHTEGSRLGQWFMKHFPNVYQLIADNKRKAYQNLSIEMQHIEAGLVVDVVTTALHERKIWCASIHDSIVCRPGDQEAVQLILADAFERAAGIKPSIKPESLKK